MKVLKAYAGSLSNFEVLDFLRARGATSDPMGCIGAAAPSECKVFDYLTKTAACNQTRESIHEFLQRCERFKLLKNEKLNIINLRPSNQAVLDPIITEHSGKRMTEDEVQELVDIVLEVLPPPPPKPDEAMEEVPAEDAMEEN